MKERGEKLCGDPWKTIGSMGIRDDSDWVSGGGFQRELYRTPEERDFVSGRVRVRVWKL